MSPRARPRRRLTSIAALAALAALVSCAPVAAAPPRPVSPPPPSPPVTAAPLPSPPSPPPAPPEPPPEPAAVPETPQYDSTLPTEVKVPGDLVALVAHGPVGDRRAIVYLHGVCGDVTKYRAWSEAAIRHGTVVAVRGDDRCKDPGRFKWGDSVARTDSRIVAAVSAVGAVRGGLDTGSITLVGYSQGAARAEALVRALPARYPRAVLVAGPKEHAAASFRGALGIAVVAGEKDAKTHLVDAAAKAQKAGVRARYFELPEARHGEYGPEAVRVMGEALDWVFGG